MVTQLDPRTAFAAFCVEAATDIVEGLAGPLTTGHAATTEHDDMAPPSWDAYQGQDMAKAELLIRIHSALNRNARLPHTLLNGGPGTGKTTLARLMAAEAEVPLITMSRPPKNADALLDIIYPLVETGGILFVDEAHGWSPVQQHSLMEITEDGCLTTSSGAVPMPGLTVVCATTDEHKLLPPLRTRFECVPEFVNYTDTDLTSIVTGMLERAGVGDEVSAETVEALGRASGGNPRAARQLATAARDLAVTGMPTTTDAILRFTGISADGLTKQHLAYLSALGSCKHGTAGQLTMATLLNVAPAEVRFLEKVLTDRGLVAYAGGAGRQITPAGRQRLAAGR